MSKWYRISLSLATKCRIGFAFAVLVIIAAGMFIPYRWMDKLVEQGKRELALAEVDRLLQQHFQTSTNPGPKVELPSLSSTDTAVMSHPDTRWILLPPLKSTDPCDTTDRLPDDFHPEDLFLRSGITFFMDSPEVIEYFELQSPPFASDTSSERTSTANGSHTQKQNGVPAAEEPARYLHAVRAESSCLAAGCHTAQPLEPASPSETPRESPASFSEGELVGVISVIIPAAQTSTTLLFNRIFIGAGGLLSCICAIVTFYLITQRFILQPVRSLREAADKVTLEAAPTQDQAEPTQAAWQDALSITSEIKTGDEYEKMAEAFHQMLSRLKLAHDRLRESNRALDLRLGELEAKNVALFEANKLKSEFLANVSHELRTPLNAIIGFTEILKEQAQHRQDHKALRYADNVLESGKILLKIINELLDLAKIEAGKVQVTWEKCSIGSLVEALINFTRPLFEKKHITIHTNIPESLPLIVTDPAKLQQVLFNLLDNAIKFSPEKGRIDIRAYLLDHDSLTAPEVSEEEMSTLEEVIHPDGSPPTLRSYASAVPGTLIQPIANPSSEDATGQLCISISDTGPGIDPDHREKIFDKFRQLDGSVTRAHSGTGLGLAIVKELTQILGAAITVADNSPQGSIFTLILPKQPPK